MFTSGQQYARSRDRLTFDIDNTPGREYSSVASSEDCGGQKGSDDEDLSHHVTFVASCGTVPCQPNVPFAQPRAAFTCQSTRHEEPCKARGPSGPGQHTA